MRDRRHALFHLFLIVKLNLSYTIYLRQHRHKFTLTQKIRQLADRNFNFITRITLQRLIDMTRM